MESNVVPIGRKVQPIANTSYIYLGETSAVIPFSAFGEALYETMTWQRSALLFFPVWLCFALLAAGWERVSEEATFAHHNLDTEENYTKDKAVVQLGDPANVDLNADRGFQVQSEEVLDAKKWVSVTEAAPVSLAVLCGEDEFKVTLPAGPMSEVKILGKLFYRLRS